MDAAFILPDFPGVSMAVDVGLDLLSPGRMVSNNATVSFNPILPLMPGL